MLNTIDIEWMAARDSLIGVIIHGSFTFQQHHDAVQRAVALFPPGNSLVDIMADYSDASYHEPGLLSAIFEALSGLSERIGCVIVVGAPILVREAFVMAMRLDPCLKERVILADTTAEGLFLLDAARHNRRTGADPRG